MEGCFEISGRDGHRFAGSVGETDRGDAGEQLLGCKLSVLADPASVGEVFLHGRGGAGAGLGRGDTGGHFEMFGSADCFADVAGQAVGGDDAESDAGDNADARLLGLLVEIVEGPEHLEFVADVELVHSRLEAGLREWGCGVQEWAGGVEHQIDVGQCRLECGWIIQTQDPVGQAEALGQGGDGWCAPTGEHGAVTAFESTLRDQGACVPSGP